MQVEDGKGKGYRAGVTTENMLETLSVMMTLERHTNQSEKRAYHVLFDQAPTANDDCIFYMVNNSTVDLVIEGTWLSPSAACEVYFQLSDKGTRNAAAALTPVNCNAGSGNTANGTFEQGADLDGGAATLAGGVEVERYVFTATTNSTHFNFEQDIILRQNETMTIWCDTLAVTINGTVVFNYHSLED